MEEGRIYPQFYTDAVRDGAASREAQREIFKEVEMCRVLIAGDKDNNLVIRADEQFMMDKKNGGYMTPKDRWPDHYAAFKRNETDRVVGTPLDHLPFLGKAQIAELQYHNVKTAEQLAGLGEAALTKGLGWRELRTQAQVWLDTADKNAAASKLALENQALLDRIAALEEAAKKPRAKAEAA